MCFATRTGAILFPSKKGGRSARLAQPIVSNASLLNIVFGEGVGPHVSARVAANASDQIRKVVQFIFHPRYPVTISGGGAMAAIV